MSKKHYSSFEVIQILDKNINEMNRFINSDRFEAIVRETIQTQIIWFKHQISCFEFSANSTEVIDRYNWVVSNINQKLNLPKEERFDYFKQAA
ncbi:MAG: hypothetical protein P0S95_04400 [Rhabdochlamydiaceae bacterium]|nr:hypothetical protein [Candidatus Amphrikana amoebophyrae]